MEYNKTANSIQNELLQDIDDSYEKSKGYFLWDILKAIAIRLKALWTDLQTVADKLDVEKLKGEELERFIYQRTGIKRRTATAAQGMLTITGNGKIEEGAFFETTGLVRFQAVKSITVKGSGVVAIEAVTAGSNGNVPPGTITKMPVTLAGISSCINSEATTGGYEAESDADLLERYYEKLRMPATSGNIFHYQMWAKEVSGVGDAKIYPLWAGNNTVKIIIINQDRLPAQTELVQKVQEYIDPGITGCGEGVAPIGAFCTVCSAEDMKISVSVKLSVSEGFEKETIIEDMRSEISHYLASIALKSNYLSHGRIGAAILNINGVTDYKDLLLNGKAQNITCEGYQVMTLGDVIILDW